MQKTDDRVSDALKLYIAKQAARITALNEAVLDAAEKLRQIEHDLRVAQAERDYFKKRAEATD